MNDQSLTIFYICTNCGSISLEKHEVCDGCGSKVEARYFQPIPPAKAPRMSDVEWLQSIYENRALWYEAAFDDYPSVIAHEYWRLRELCSQNQPYGMLFQIRDLIEVTLKYQILVVCAWACHAQVPRFREDVASTIAIPGMVLGRWYNLGRRIEHFFSRDDLRQGDRRYHMPTELWQGLKTILEFFDSNDMIHWRNERIGHGALGFSQDETFRSDIEKMLVNFQKLFRSMQKNLSAQELWIGNQCLKGKNRARDLQLPIGHEPLSLTLKARHICFGVEPYIVEVAGGIYFFDNQKSRMLSQRLCYPMGWRENGYIPYFSELYDLRPSVDVASAVDGAFLSSKEEALIDSLGTQVAFTDPKHVSNWLKDMLKIHHSGVFLLQMCRGTGKSTYAEKISSLCKKPLVLSDDLDVRTYHVARTQMVHVTDFERHIEHLWTSQDVSGIDWARAKRIYEYRAEGFPPAESLVLFLRQCLDFTHMRRHKDRILMVIDGLDEIVDELPYESVWDYLPNERQLPEGVYLLLTSRDPQQEELPETVVEHLEKLQLTERRSVLLESADNQTMMKAYLDTAKIGKLTDSEKQLLMQLAGYRILYLGMLCRLVKAGQAIEALASPEKLVTSYIKLLINCYGEKESRHLRELLSILCTLGRYEPLSLREIASLIGNGEVTIDLVSKINDLAPMLKVERGFIVDHNSKYGFALSLVQQYEGENRYSLANAELAEAMQKQLPESIEIVRGIIETALIISKHAILSDEQTIEDDETCVRTNESALLVLAHWDKLDELTRTETQHPSVQPFWGSYVTAEGAGKIVRFIVHTEGMPDQTLLTNQRKKSALWAMSWMSTTDTPSYSCLQQNMVIARALQDMNAYDASLWSHTSKGLDQLGKTNEALSCLQYCIAYAQENMTDHLGYDVPTMGDLQLFYDDYARICIRNNDWDQCLVFCDQHPDFINQHYYMHTSLVGKGDGVNERILNAITEDWRGYIRSLGQPAVWDQLGAYLPFVRLFQERIAEAEGSALEEDAHNLRYALAAILLEGWTNTPDVYGYDIPYDIHCVKQIWSQFAADYSSVNENIYVAFESVCEKLNGRGLEKTVRDTLDILREQIKLWRPKSFNDTVFLEACELFVQYGLCNVAIELLNDRLQRSGTSFFVRVALARLYKSKGRHEEALHEMEQALHLTDDIKVPYDSVSVNLLMADILDELGRTAEAGAYRRTIITSHRASAEKTLQAWKAGQLTCGASGTNFLMGFMMDELLTVVEQHILLHEWHDAIEIFQTIEQCGWAIPEEDTFHFHDKIDDRMAALRATLSKHFT